MPPEDLNQLNARVSVLEDRWEEHREWMKRISEGVDRLNTGMTSLRLCGSPNLCTTLEKEVEELAKEIKNAMERIESLERWRIFINGVTATIGIIWLVLQVILPWFLGVKGG